jgi:dephospho-CoA kinase
VLLGPERQWTHPSGAELGTRTLEPETLLPMPAIGITGGVATGKTTVARALFGLLTGELRVSLFSSDFEAKRLTETDFAVQEEIRSAFGDRVFNPDGNLARNRLRELVFQEAKARKTLEDILHPRIRRAWIEQVRSEQLLLAEIPLLYETAAERNFDLIIVTACSRKSQTERLVGGRNLSEALAEQVISAQMALETKIQHADRVVWTDCPRSIAALQVNRIAREIIDRYGGSAN